MHVLGLHTGHGATVALLRDGKVIACASEERFNRKKNFIGWPKEALAFCLEFAGIGIDKIDLVVVPNTDPRAHALQLGDPSAYLLGNLPPGKPTIAKRLKDTVKRQVIRSPGLWEAYDRRKSIDEPGAKRRIEAEYARRLGIPAQKVLLMDHHLAHAASTAFNLPRDRKTLVFTLDGEGDGVCATVNVYDGARFWRMAQTPKGHSIGLLYLQVTRFLGMKGNEHEFKVMGLAPYAKDEYIDKVAARLRQIITLDPKDRLRFKAAFPMGFSDVWLDEHLRGVRFDNIAGGAQRITEELIVEWVKEGIRRTGLKHIAIVGGTFMNVKANMRLAQLPEVEGIFVMPSGGDESLVFGCCWHGYHELAQATNTPFQPIPITDLYLGREWTDEQIGAYLKENGFDRKYKVKRSKAIEEDIAELLARGQVVARLNGRSEWGARALGNRSILANPSDFETVKLINEMIKNRDFWMPFTPSVLDKDADRYIVNPKRIFAPYMAITFESTPLGRQHLPAAMHPYDHTIRPQVVIEKWNPSYHRVITAFKKRTGIGAVLNTSFNLHGEPNVDSPADAMHTFEGSGLRNLAMGNWLIQK